MNFLILLPVCALVICSALSVAILSRGARQRATRLGAAMTLAAAYWACCELLWSGTSDPEVALYLIRFAAIGWISIGPITCHLFLELSGHPMRRSRPLLAALYGTNAALLLISVTTPLLDRAAIRTPWGWGYEVGPAFPFAYAFVAATFIAGLGVGIRTFRKSTAAAERRQAMVLMGGMMLSLGVASVTDGILPALGHQVPRLGVLSIAVFSSMVVWDFQHFGQSLLAPGSFATEILATLPDGVVLLHMDGRIRSANRAMEGLAAAPAGGLEARPIGTLVEDFSPSSREILGERECVLRTDSGELVPVALSSSLLHDKGHRTIGIVVIVRDLREVKSLRSRLVVADRLAAVGQLAAGIAHEINNPIAYVRANLGGLGEILDQVGSKLTAALQTELEATLDEGRELVDESIDGVDRVSAIVRDVKSFSHSGEAKAQLFQIEPLLDSVLRMAAPQWPSGARVERDYAADTPAVRGSAQELKQVFLNLAINAAQAVGEGDRIRVRTRCEEGRVLVSVEDEGCGIEPGVIERIFDPFFTTKPVGEGTGLGLSISYQIVHDHGGEISAESEPGCGACFRVTLPAADTGD